MLFIMLLLSFATLSIYAVNVFGVIDDYVEDILDGVDALFICIFFTFVELFVLGIIWM